MCVFYFLDPQNTKAIFKIKVVIIFINIFESWMIPEIDL